MRDYSILKSSVVILILLTSLLGSVACSGVSQEEFDTLSEDLDSAQARAQQHEADLGVAQRKVKDIEIELAIVQSKANDTETELAIALSKAKDIEMELDRARAKLSDHSNNADGDYEDLRYRAWQARLMVSSFNEFMQIGITGDSSNFIQLLGLLADIENPVIQESLQYLMENSDDISGDESFLIIMSWLVEAEKLLRN